jgi:hypothetical protein
MQLNSGRSIGDWVLTSVHLQAGESEYPKCSESGLWTPPPLRPSNLRVSTGIICADQPDAPKTTHTRRGQPCVSLSGWIFRVANLGKESAHNKLKPV